MSRCPRASVLYLLSSRPLCGYVPSTVTLAWRILPLLLCLLVATTTGAHARPASVLSPATSTTAPARIYLYAHNNPVNGIDPSGHEDINTQFGTLGGISHLAARVAGSGNQAFYRMANLVSKALINQDRIALYAESAAALLTAGTVVGSCAAEAAVDLIEKASSSWLNNTRSVPGEWSARGFALEAVAGEHIGEAYVGGNVERIDIFSNKGATIAGSIKTHVLDASLPNYEGRLLGEITKDARALVGIEDISLGGTTRTGQAFLKPPGTIDAKVLLIGIAEDQALVMNSRVFLQRVRDIAAQTRTIILTIPVRGLKGR